MNYWPAEMTGLGELTKPLFDYMEVRNSLMPVKSIVNENLENMGTERC